MKKSKFLSFLAAFALIFAACNNVGDEPDGPDSGGNGNGGNGTNKTVADMLAMPLPDKGAGTETFTVEAYVVGSYNFNHNPKFIIGTENAGVDQLLIADDPENTDTYKVVVLKLGDYKPALNLVNNPGNYKKKIVVTGTFEKYCGAAGLVDLTKVILDGKEVTAGAQNSDVDLTGDTTTPVTEINEDFSTVQSNKDIALKDWKLFAVKGDRNWQGKEFTDKESGTTNQYAQASAHNGKAEDYEYWLVTPPVNADGLKEKTLTFKTAQAYWQDTSSLKLFVLQNKDGKTTRTEITTAKLAGKDDKQYTFVESGNVDLSAYKGTIYIAWQYIAKGGASNSTTFQIDDVVVK